MLECYSRGKMPYIILKNREGISGEDFKKYAGEFAEAVGKYDIEVMIEILENSYYYDENGKRCITEEDLEASRKDTNYSERTGVGFRVYPYPSYGNQSVDSTGNSYSKSSREMVKEGYDEMEKEALKAWNVDMLTDIFPQKEEFSKDAYSPLWAMTLPDELEKMLVALDNVSWKGLIECVVSPADDFDAKWDELQQNLKDAGLEKADREMTALLRDEISRRE